MVNIGQRIREQHSTDGVVTVASASYKESVFAGRKWSDSMRKIKVPEAVEGSWEQTFHLASNGQNRLLLINKRGEMSIVLYWSSCNRSCLKSRT